MPQLTLQQRLQNAQEWYRQNREAICVAIATSETGLLRLSPAIQVGAKIIESLDYWDEQLQQAPANLLQCYYLRPLRNIRSVIEGKADSQ